MKKICTICLIVLLAGFSVSTISTSQETSSQEQNIHGQLQRYLDDQVALLNIPGAVLHIDMPGQPPISLSSGVSDLALGTKLTPSDRFRIASITKTFTAAAILLLAEDGRLSLDDIVETWLPASVPNADTITLRHLLNHTSGIADFYQGERGIKLHVSENPLKIWTPDELIHVGVSMSPLHEPGQQWAYSNTAYVMLGQIIEKASGSSYESFLRRRILEPLDLHDTFVPTEAAIRKSHAHGYLDRNEDGSFEDVTPLHPSVIWSAGAMISTAPDLARWAKAMYSGELFNDDSMRAMFSFVNTTYGEIQYGLGIYKYREGIVGHDGDFMGYSSQIIYVSDAQISISVLTNSLPPHATDIAVGALQLLSGT